jgi:hypothetical protein
MSNETASRINDWGEQIYLPPTFEHPNVGKFKTMPEAWWENRTVRLYLDVLDGDQPARVACWLDFLRFEDQVVDGRPVRMGVGKLQRTIGSYLGGAEFPFGVEEIFDVVERVVLPEGGEYRAIAAI